MNIQILFEDMPTTIRAFSKLNQDDSYTIVINSRLTREQQLESYNHEMQHINNDDFNLDCEAGILEHCRH